MERNGKCRAGDGYGFLRHQDDMNDERRGLVRDGPGDDAGHRRLQVSWTGGRDELVSRARNGIDEAHSSGQRWLAATRRHPVCMSCWGGALPLLFSFSGRCFPSSCFSPLGCFLPPFSGRLLSLHRRVPTVDGWGCGRGQGQGRDARDGTQYTVSSVANARGGRGLESGVWGLGSGSTNTDTGSTQKCSRSQCDSQVGRSGTAESRGRKDDQNGGCGLGRCLGRWLASFAGWRGRVGWTRGYKKRDGLYKLAANTRGEAGWDATVM
ncbi:hypothetical protein B0T19DRAFT_60870 [Cercophora scortea]|uniref:Uncharacterized protein n=1 Tax=Cercophora scortea TaxID=314031 RepID=A0AAE0J583_9PEZI|nr:hypothetical protein B0T19DRAFT_60870 [Cercophora scortea]